MNAKESKFLRDIVNTHDNMISDFNLLSDAIQGVLGEDYTKLDDESSKLLLGKTMIALGLVSQLLTKHQKTMVHNSEQIRLYMEQSQSETGYAVVHKH